MTNLSTLGNLFEGTIHVKFPKGSALEISGSQMSDAEFYEFCLQNPELRIERSANGKLLIIPPTGSETGYRNAEISAEFVIWNRKEKLGLVFDSSTGFRLPNGAERSPDTAWVRHDRWEAIAPEQRRRFAPVAPDFVMELHSEGQSLHELREKMNEYIDGGCRLGWLIDPTQQKTYVYSENGDIQTVHFDESLSGGEVLPRFRLRLADLFN